MRSQFIKFGTVTQAEKRKTIMLVQTEDSGALELLKEMFETNEVLALDTEYMPHINPHKQTLCYIQIGGALGDCIFIIGQLYFTFLKNLLIDWLKKPQSLLLGFYLMADLTILSTQFQIAPKQFEWKVFDFYLFFKLLSPQLKKHSLKNWALRICDIELDKSFQKTNWLEEALTEDKKHYMMMDALILLKFLKYLPEIDGYDWANTWVPDCYHEPLCTSIQLDQVLLPLFVDITLKGVFIEETQLVQVSQEFYEKLLENCELLGCTLEQLRSAKKLEQVLSQSSLPGMSECLSAWPRTQTGHICLGADTLNAFLYGEDLTPECLQWFTHYFQTKKSLSEWTNAQKFAQYIDDDFIYPSWDIFGAATGRIITREPALNSTPRGDIFREMFRATAGHGFIVCDYSMIEIVIIAVISQDATMLKNIYEKKDLHMFLASQVLEKPYEQLMAFKQTDPQEYKKTRTPMKSVNFGLLYGMGAKTLWIRLISQGNTYTQAQVQHIHNVWTKTYTGITKYKQMCQSAITQNYLQAPKIPASVNALTSLRGRVARDVDTITSTYNFPIQATCADILKTALRLFYLSKQKAFIKEDVTVVLTAHDEIVFQCATSQVEQVEKQVVALMMAAANKILKPLDPEIEVEVESGVGDSWAAQR
uniref:DNA-directed DNA polymerase n=1 Tax=Johnson-sea-linkia profunda TaxID=575876 RepID=A0A386AXK0_9CHLO|nr:hypothetical protein [Johnson-sea-linkia profunda]